MQYLQILQSLTWNNFSIQSSCKKERFIGVTQQTQPVCNRILLQITETRNGKTFSSVAWNIDTTIIGVTLHLISTFSTVSCNRVCSGSAACSITRCSSPSVCLSGTHSGGPGFRTRGSVGASRWICSVWGAAVSKLSMNLLCSSLRLPARCTAIVYFAPRWEDRLTLRDKWEKCTNEQRCIIQTRCVCFIMIFEVKQKEFCWNRNQQSDKEVKILVAALSQHERDALIT